MAPIWLLAVFATGVSLASKALTVDLRQLCLIAALCGLCWFITRRSRMAWVPCAAAVFLAGMLSAMTALSPPAGRTHINHFADLGPVTVCGRVASVEPAADGGRVLIATRRIVINDRSAKVDGRLLLYVREGGLSLRPGSQLWLRVSLEQPVDFGTPGEFRYARYLAARNIFVTAAVDRMDELAVLAGDPGTLATRIETWRLAIAARIAAAVPETDAGLVQALVVGLRSGISQTRRQQLADGGVAHLFAISGLHFGLLALLLYRAGSILYRNSHRLLLWRPPQKVIPLILLAPLAGYLMLTGSAWSTRRAFAMMVVVVISFCVNRRVPPMQLLAIVALGLLLGNPLALFEPGFQLSFAALAGILSAVPDWQRRMTVDFPGGRTLVAIFLTTCAATIATTPLTLWHFHQASPAGLLGNLIAIPVIAWGAVPAGLLGALLCPVSPEGADTCFAAAGMLVSKAIESTTWLSRLPLLGPVETYLTAPRFAAAALIAICLLLPWHRKRLRLPGFLLVVLAITVCRLPNHRHEHLQIMAISVGQGDATLISYPGGVHVLVDGGGFPKSAYDPGERLVGPTLGRLGITRLDAIILSHDHPDHRDGLRFIVDRFDIGAFWSGLHPDRLPAELRQSLMRRHVPIETLPRGWTEVAVGERHKLSIFTPDQHDPDLNERSLVVYAGSNTTGALLTADLGRPGLRQLAVDQPPGPVSLLKVPHHGSRRSGPGLFAATFTPEIAFVSAGHDNPYNLPHPETLKAFRARQVRLYRTDRQGTCTFHLTSRGWAVDIEKKGFSVD